MLVLSSGFRIDVDTNSKLKAVFIMNFTKLIDWPESTRKGDFVIGVIGNSPLHTELVKMAKTKKVANQSLNVQKFNNPNEIKSCHILFVSKNKSLEISSIVNKTKPYNTLVVTENPGLIDKGSGINFVVKNNRQKFELNKKNVERYNLKISSSLESLALTVK